MKNAKKFLTLATTLALFATSLNSAFAEPMKDPLRINNIFIPAEGFDDNDNIEFVLDGELKNACLRLGASTVRHDGKMIYVGLEAIRDEESFCAQADDSLPQAIQATVPFSKEVDIGKLKAGEYTIHYETANVVVTKTFKVGVAPSNRQDSMNYAPIENASVTSLVNIGDTAQIRLTGMLTSSCMHLRDEVLVSQADDVVVVQPLVKMDLSSMCLMYLRPFTKDVSVPNLSKGRYLVHVRSMNGQAVNRVFSVCQTNSTGDCSSSSLGREETTR